MPAILAETPVRPIQPSLAARASSVARDMRDAACDHIELAVLEAHRAGIRFTKVLGAAVIAAILIVSAWLTLVASGIVWAAAEGVSWALALAIAASINLLVAVGMIVWIRGPATESPFAATLRQLRRDAAMTERTP